MKRLLYLGYYLKNLDKEKFNKFFDHVKKEHKMDSISLMTDIISSSLKYKISLLEYFQFRFYELTKEQRKSYAGTGYMYEYQLAMNPKLYRECLDNKIDFYKKYSDFVRHMAFGIDELRENSSLAPKLLANPSGKVVLKDSVGKCGMQVKVFKTEFFEGKDLISFMDAEKFDFAEEFVVQHPDIMALSPSALNTVRVFTQLNDKDEVEFLGARLRISVNSEVDNMAAGNIAAPINIETGIIDAPGVYSDITKDDAAVHPVTGVSIVGFQVPFWPEIIDMMKKSALHMPGNRSIGWDIAVTKDGPELIEGNHDWCKLVWQLPAKKGMKKILENHLAKL
ncbi:sugar-transfer associated ATP-grasp domain-containing protein [Flavobacterium sp.]|uniref:sugar-transfer associated ATP-grasp domain-containing protein n=2 Tax=Flavobacterium sp. TaxID=239 RepID=UPI004034582A